MLTTFRLDALKLPTSLWCRWRWRTWREWCFFRVLCRQFALRGLLMAAGLSSGASLFLWLEPEKMHTFPRALFFTWSLVFAQPPEDFPSHPLLQALFFLMPIFGLTVIIEGILEFSQTLRVRRGNEKSWHMTMAQAMRDHVILIGLGRLGYRTFLILRRLGHRVVVVEKNKDSHFLADVRADGSPLLIGDARHDPVLAEANVANARGIVLATNDDLANLEIALDARRISPGIRVVLRMFDQDMADKVRDGFNIQIAMSQSSISAPAFALAAVEPAVVNSFVVNDELIVIQRWNVQTDGPLVSLTCEQILRQHGCAVVEYRRLGGTPLLFPDPQTRLECGDEVLLQGRYETLLRLRSGRASPTTTR